MPINEINTNSYTPSKSSAASKFLLDSIASPQFIAPSNGLNTIHDRGNFRSIDADTFIWQGFEELALYYASSPERIIDDQVVWESPSISSPSSSDSSVVNESESVTIEDGEALLEPSIASDKTNINSTSHVATSQKGFDIVESGFFLTQGDTSFVEERLPIAGVSSWGWL